MLDFVGWVGSKNLLGSSFGMVLDFCRWNFSTCLKRLKLGVHFDAWLCHLFFADTFFSSCEPIFTIVLPMSSGKALMRATKSFPGSCSLPVGKTDGPNESLAETATPSAMLKFHNPHCELHPSFLFDSARIF